MKRVMPNNKKKFIFFIAILVVTYMMLIPLTFAAELTKEEKKIEKKCSDDAMEGKYNPKVIDNGDGTLTFKIDPDKGYGNISFDFSAITPSNAVTDNGIKKLEKAVLTKDNPITVSLNDSSTVSEVEVEVVFLNVKKDKDKCINRKVIFAYTPFVAKDGKRGAVRATEELPNIDIDYGFLSEDSDEDNSEVGMKFKELFKKGFIAMLKRDDKLSQTDAEKKYASFGDESDYAYKARVDDLIKRNNNAEKPKDLTGSSALKCDYKVKKDEEINKDEYYTEENTQNFVHAYKEDSITAHYTYNYAPNATVDEKSHAVCNRICVEALEAQYGPPVASKAGFCFEYKVKVRSIVRCHAKLEDDAAPKKQNTVCTPSPICYGSSAKATRQGGSNQDFDSCINSCDGGKYTASCSNKCYQKVYGKEKGNLSLYENVNAEKMALSVDQCIKKQKKYTYSGVYSYGCYFWNDNSTRSVSWRKGDESIENYGRWFYQTGYDPGRPTYGTQADGIKRHIYDNDWCHDTCYWLADTCQRDEYLNFGFAADDYKNNMKQYELAIEECKAKATCTTKTAEFTISANYGDETNPDWVDFPQGYDHDSLTSPADEGSLNTSTNEKTTIIDAGDNTCYNNERDNSRQYLTEWTFPGTWIENKTGQMSYDTPPTKDGWYQEKKQFCVRFDAKDVNQKWWNYYMSVKYGNGDYSYQEDAYEDECNNYVSTTTDSKFTKEDVNNINWNLKAITKNFGYFGWNIEMRCFYALNSDPSSDLKSSSDKNTMCDTNLNYRVRSVNNDNLFPSSEGEVLESKDETGREPGFNWTSAAKITYDKTSGGASTASGSGSGSSDTIEELDANGYAIDPETLIKLIQNKGDEIYQDGNCLDYSFHLTPKVLKEIKKDNSVNIKYDYTKFNGEYRYENGYGYYISDLFRNGSSDGGKDYVTKLPAISKLGKNNNGTCYSYKGD